MCENLHRSVPRYSKMKACTKCKEVKPMSEFWRDRSKKHGFSARCKLCKTKDHNAYRKANGYDAKRYAKNPTGERERHLIRKYGVTLTDYQEMYHSQSGCCAICRKQQERAFDVDHNHATGEVRGLLCTNCNRMLGHAGDSASNLRAAAYYLESFPKSRRSS